MTDLIIADVGTRQLYARFTDAVWRQDAQSGIDCFTDSAEWKLAGFHLRGHDEIGGAFTRLLSACARIVLIHGTPILELDDGGASGRVLVTELTQMADGSSAMTVGVYYDRYVQQADRWRFQQRHFGLHYRGPIDFSAELVESPEFGPPPGMPPADEPTVTRRKGVGARHGEHPPGTWPAGRTCATPTST